MYKILLLVTLIHAKIYSENQVPSGLNVQKIYELIKNKSNIDPDTIFSQIDLSLPTLRISTNFAAQLLTIIFQEQDVTVQTDDVKSFFEQFEIDLNTDTMQSIFKQKFEEKKPVNFVFHFNTTLHVKLNTKKCSRDKFEMVKNQDDDPRPSSCLVVPFNIELFGHQYLSLLKVEFYLLRTLSYSRFVITNLYFDFYDDQSQDTLIKADELKNFINQTLFYAVGSINFSFSQVYQSLIDKYEQYCHNLNVKQAEEEYYIACL